MSKRTAISKRQRFRILARDGFRCRYCGRGAAVIELEVDHVNPVALGGTNDDGNLVTACGPCNAGKAALQLAPANKLHYTDYIPKVAFLLRNHPRPDECEEIRHMGFLIHELSGDVGLYAAAEEIGEIAGWDALCSLDHHWDGIGTWLA
jgi:hypothetical protein